MNKLVFRVYFVAELFVKDLRTIRKRVIQATSPVWSSPMEKASDLCTGHFFVNDILIYLWYEGVFGFGVLEK